MTPFPEPPRELVVDHEITLRPVFESADEIYRLASSQRDYLRQFLPFPTDNYSLEDSRAFAEQKRADWGVTGEQAFGIWRQGKFSGAIGIRGFDAPNRACSIGYWLSQDLQGRGIMTRCVSALLKLAFETYGMNQVVITAAPDNTRSRAIPERLGFTRTGIKRQWSVNASGELLDLVEYSLLKSEWEAREK
jgi:ribosomal-protein-serine acetyltransferase